MLPNIGEFAWTDVAVEVHAVVHPLCDRCPRFTELAEFSDWTDAG
ncbi:hypothetical protein [Arthrobacter sp. MMS24-S77]